MILIEEEIAPKMYNFCYSVAPWKNEEILGIGSELKVYVDSILFITGL